MLPESCKSENWWTALNGVEHHSIYSGEIVSPVGVSFWLDGATRNWGRQDHYVMDSLYKYSQHSGQYFTLSTFVCAFVCWEHVTKLLTVIHASCNNVFYDYPPITDTQCKDWRIIYNLILQVISNQIYNFTLQAKTNRSVKTSANRQVRTLWSVVTGGQIPRVHLRARSNDAGCFGHFFYSPFVSGVPPPRSCFFFSLLPWHSRSSSVRLLEWMMESCVLPSNCGFPGNLARTAAFACQWGEMKLIKGGIKWVSRTEREETERMMAIKENNQVLSRFPRMQHYS